MKHTRPARRLAGALAVAAIAAALGGCAAAVVGGAVATGMVATDRRSTGAQLDDQNIELRIVDPKTLEFKDKIDPRHIPADRMSDAALKANAKAIGFVQPPLFAQDEDGTLTIISGRRRLRAGRRGR